MEPQIQIITIVVHSDVDPSDLLEIANGAAEHIICEIHDNHDTSAFFHEEETSVELKDNDSFGILGGE